MEDASWHVRIQLCTFNVRVEDERKSSSIGLFFPGESAFAALGALLNQGWDQGGGDRLSSRIAFLTALLLGLISLQLFSAEYTSKLAGQQTRKPIRSFSDVVRFERSLYILGKHCLHDSNEDESTATF